jgi:fatty-acyl-CoA synthase
MILCIQGPADCEAGKARADFPQARAAISELPEVAEVAVIGIPDERWGEVGRAYVVPASGHQVSEALITDHCAKRLARFKIPKSVVTTDTLPRTASGKLQKHVLKAQAGD